MSLDIKISQSVAILIDGNNIERSLHSETGDTGTMVNFDILIPRLIGNRSLNRLIYFREGAHISSKLAERLHDNFHGSVIPCHKTADIPLAIKATQLAGKVDTIIIMSGDSDYVDLVKYLRNEGVRVEIAAVPKNTAEALKTEADYFHQIVSNDWFSLTKNKPRGPHTTNQGSKTERISAGIAQKASNKPAQKQNAPKQNQAAKPNNPNSNTGKPNNPNKPKPKGRKPNPQKQSNPAPAPSPSPSSEQKN